jgi:hypothetical protein
MRSIVKPTLKQQANKKVEKENSFLYEKFYVICFNHLLDSKHWYYIVFFTLSFFFFLQIIDIDFLNNLEITDKDVKILIESRTTNIVTLISVTFAIIGFLIANLAIKDSYIYNLIFKNSRFFSIAYFVLSLIASFIILSTLREYISIDNVKRILIAGTYLILIGIFLIGYLFTRLILYTNDKFLNKIVGDDFNFESKQYLRDMLTEDYMKGILFKELGFGNYNTNFYQNQFSSYNDGKLTVNSIVKDIKIESVKKILKENNISHNIVYLNVNYEEKFAINQNGFFFILNSNNNINYEEIIKKLNSCIILQKNDIELLSIESVIDYINDKVVEHTSKNNHKKATEFTEIYSKYYELQIKTKLYV